MSDSTSHPATTDGAIGATQTQSFSRKASQSPPRDDTCCIFVHAGAGYHSIQNERIHLEACNDAAQVAMLILKNGGTAVDAVEMAVKILEDREITNAGYGSNLAMDGVVECDASIVDHHGRSGAVGAVAQIKNPISLARLVLNHTMQTLTLRRVPPNLLVSQGATDFACEMDIPILPYDALVSPAAHERWLRWKADLRSAERKARKNGNSPLSYKLRKDSTADEEHIRKRMRIEHQKKMLQHAPYENRPMSPDESDDSPQFCDLQQNFDNTKDPSNVPGRHSEGSAASCPSEERSPTPESPLSELSKDPIVDASHTRVESSRSALINSTQKVPKISELRDCRALRDVTSEFISEDTEMRDIDSGSSQVLGHTSGRRSYGDGSEESDSASSAKTMKSLQPAPYSPSTATGNNSFPETPFEKHVEKHVENPAPRKSPALSHVNENAPYLLGSTEPASRLGAKEDDITDTVGAIAVDAWGNIACGASSGGIGMKYRGRVGPAALVGVGAAVVPIDPDDAERTCVATVTSGTGEHMATTMAATVCAERLYQSVRKGKGGIYEEVTEDEALKAMIDNEFMGHPSVKNSNSAGAIGILGIKKVRSGVFFYFGHNTDSFAMASMHSDEERPLCAMSRSNGNGQIAQGGRMLKYRTKKKQRITGPIR